MYKTEEYTHAIGSYEVMCPYMYCHTRDSCLHFTQMNSKIVVLLKTEE